MSDSIPTRFSACTVSSSQHADHIELRIRGSCPEELQIRRNGSDATIINDVRREPSPFHLHSHSGDLGLVVTSIFWQIVEAGEQRRKPQWSTFLKFRVTMPQHTYREKDEPRAGIGPLVRRLCIQSTLASIKVNRRRFGGSELGRKAFSLYWVYGKTESRSGRQRINSTFLEPCTSVP